VRIGATLLSYMLDFGTDLLVGTGNITPRSGLARHSGAFHLMLAFDAVAGVTSRCLLQAIPVESKVVVYGALSEQGMSVSPRADLQV